MTSQLRHYIERYAEPLSEGIPHTDHFHHALVIPALRESWTQLRQSWKNVTQLDRVLVILVINAPDPDPITEQLFEDAITSRQITASVGGLTYLAGEPGLLLVDHCHTGRYVDSRLGVGLARKLGFDIAARLYEAGCLSSPMVGTTDADARLPNNYFESGFCDATAALVYPFRHELCGDLAEAMSLYELSLLHYAYGLRSAGSPYGFTSIGSTMAVHLEHYARVRGVPKRNAAEDFYLLNKLAKSGSIDTPRTDPVTIEGRKSNRVPFGTGASITKIQALDDPTRDYRFYHPGVFEQLAILLRALNGSWQQPGISEHLPGTLQQWASLNRLDQRLADQHNRCKSEAVYQKFIHDWMDGFRTLKLIHHLRANEYPSVPLSELPIPGESATQKCQHLTGELFPSS